MWLDNWNRWKRTSLKSFISLFLVVVSLTGALALLAVGIAACSPGNSSNASGKKELTLVSYAVTRAAYKNIIPLFAKHWQEKTGQTVTFGQSYGSSGSQTRAVINGLEADIVALALSADTLQIQDAGLIKPGWEKKTPNGDGIVHRSVGVIVTREGNPKNIQDWDDLARDDVKVITANPKTSGGARWNYMALWGKVTKTGGTEAQAKDFVTKVYGNVPVLPRDAREATDAFFVQKQGDALINYENEVILAKQQGQDLPYVVPDINISIDSPIAIVDSYVDKQGNREVAEAFVQFLFTPEAQREFAKVGFRSVIPEVVAEFSDTYPQISTLFTIQDFGGWNQVSPKFFADGAIFDDIQTNIARR
ncbi:MULTISPECIES: sulfate ABC transporter substrate-binding protein [Cyanophyceae]|uniref:sulfate ABC transporter substrate-binding protein n=1 Tax=Cyanophyceae TaxID=3028117 RepID=UPI00232F5FD4|nr:MULTISPECIES: sulfate ABC transporter substrate-binding protein [Cyanophyceae]MDB9356995.1 sulfate ABC transporter substrate-binding protein [Nodularia spumigena CS-587/03]MDB9339823.1 sulfate ABC transporter substrate-binding protein [Nodularia spumigena CS-589/07]MDB9400001.1 sulfate ABC transporter substrate-binding protein [Microcystis aeruginosa CS-567/02-A1]MDB9499883.1 sulfate ABC transporter substrate-binding protein [Nodularia spumigena CS-336/02]MDB9531435.1 sulfate ABC transporte